MLRYAGRWSSRILLSTSRRQANCLVTAGLQIFLAGAGASDPRCIPAEATEAKVKGDQAMVAAMLECHQAVADEYTIDALKIQQQMEDLIAVREYADKADFVFLAFLFADASRGGKRRCQEGIKLLCVCCDGLKPRSGASLQSAEAC